MSDITTAEWNSAGFYGDIFEKKGGFDYEDIEKANSDDPARQSYLKAAKLLYELDHDGKPPPSDMSDDDVIEYAKNEMKWFSQNTWSLGKRFKQLKFDGVTAEQRTAFGYLMEFHDKSKTDISDVWNFIDKGILRDATTYIGIFTAGTGTVASQALKKTAQMGLKELLEESVKVSAKKTLSFTMYRGVKAGIQRYGLKEGLTKGIGMAWKAGLKNRAIAVAAEGVATSVYDDSLRQSIRIDNGLQKQWSWGQSALSFGAGALLGDAFTVGGSAVIASRGLLGHINVPPNMPWLKTFGLGKKQTLNQTRANTAGFNSPTGNATPTPKNTIKLASGPVPQSNVISTKISAIWNGVQNSLGTWKFHKRFGPNIYKQHNALKYWGRFVKYRQKSNLGHIAKQAYDIANSLSTNGWEMGLKIFDNKILAVQKSGKEYIKAVEKYKNLSPTLQKQSAQQAALRDARDKFLKDVGAISANVHEVNAAGQRYRSAVIEAKSLIDSDPNAIATKYKDKLFSIMETDSNGKPGNGVLSQDKNIIDETENVNNALNQLSTLFINKPKNTLNLNQLNAANILIDRLDDIDNAIANNGNSSQLHMLYSRLYETADNHLSDLGTEGADIKDLSKIIVDEYSKSQPDTRLISDSINELKTSLQDIRKDNIPKKVSDDVATLDAQVQAIKDNILTQNNNYLPTVLGDARNALENATKRFTDVDDSIMKKQVRGYLRSYFYYWKHGYILGMMNGTNSDEIARFKNVFGDGLFGDLHVKMRVFEVAESWAMRENKISGRTVRPEDIESKRTQMLQDMVDLVKKSGGNVDQKMSLLADFISERIQFTTMQYDVDRMHGLSPEFNVQLSKIKDDLPPIIYDTVKAAYDKQVGTANVERIGGSSVDMFYYRHPGDRLSDFMNENEIPWVQKRLSSSLKYLRGLAYDEDAIKQSKDKWGKYRYDTVYKSRDDSGGRLKCLGRSMWRLAVDPIRAPWLLMQHYKPLKHTIIAGSALGLTAYGMEEAAEHYGNDGKDFDSVIADLPQTIVAKPIFWFLNRTTGAAYRWESRLIKAPTNLALRLSGSDYRLGEKDGDLLSRAFYTGSTPVFGTHVPLLSSVLSAGGNYNLNHDRLGKAVAIPYGGETYTPLGDWPGAEREKLEKAIAELAEKYPELMQGASFKIEDGKVVDINGKELSTEDLKTIQVQFEETAKELEKVKADIVNDKKFMEKAGLEYKDGQFINTADNTVLDLATVIQLYESMKELIDEPDLPQGKGSDNDEDVTSPPTGNNSNDGNKTNKPVEQLTVVGGGGNPAGTNTDNGNDDGTSLTTDFGLDKQDQEDLSTFGRGAKNMLGGVWDTVSGAFGAAMDKYPRGTPLLLSLLGGGLLAKGIFGKSEGSGFWNGLLKLATVAVVGFLGYSAFRKDGAVQGGGNHIITTARGDGRYGGGRYTPARGTYGLGGTSGQIQGHKGGLPTPYIQSDILLSSNQSGSGDTDTETQSGSGDTGGVSKDTKTLSGTYKDAALMSAVEVPEEPVEENEVYVLPELKSEFSALAAQKSSTRGGFVDLNVLNEFNGKTQINTNQMASQSAQFLPVEELEGDTFVDIDLHNQKPDAEIFTLAKDEILAPAMIDQALTKNYQVDLGANV